MPESLLVLKPNGGLMGSDLPTCVEIWNRTATFRPNNHCIVTKMSSQIYCLTIFQIGVGPLNFFGAVHPFSRAPQRDHGLYKVLRELFQSATSFGVSISTPNSDEVHQHRGPAAMFSRNVKHSHLRIGICTEIFSKFVPQFSNYEKFELFSETCSTWEICEIV